MKTTKKVKKTKKITPSQNIKNMSSAQKSCATAWSASIYVYWFIILFFIAATFYLLGKHNNPANKINSNDEIGAELSEEQLKMASDYYENAKAKLFSSDLSGAIADLTAAIDDGAQTVEIYILRGEAYMQQGDFNNAMSDFNSALALDDNSEVAYYDRALLYTSAEAYDFALNDLNKALALSAQNADSILQERNLYAQRGRINLWLKNYEGAVADFSNSLARPDGIVSYSVYADRAEALVALNQYADAINDYESAIRIINEQIQGATTDQEKENLSNKAMDYFEHSAALNLKIDNKDTAYSNLEAARTLAISLGNAENVEKYETLMSQINE
ncbi:MAG: tetratricopeptide repeat protein [Alphaproteobacteria bacterium]